MITRQQAIESYQRQIFYHLYATNADGTALRARVNGKCKVWKTRPLDFQLPMKHGLRDCFYLTQRNNAEWSVTEPTKTSPPSLQPLTSIPSTLTQGTKS